MKKLLLVLKPMYCRFVVAYWRWSLWARKGQVRAGAGVTEREIELAVVKRGDDLLDRLALREVDRLDRRFVRVRVAGIATVRLW